MNSYNLVGIHEILSTFPLWGTVLILYLFTDGVMHFGRDLFEGLGYQIAYSAKFGDVALFGCVFIAATILQRGGPVLPGWMMDNNHQIAVLIVCLAAGVAVTFTTLSSRAGRIMDIYHDIVIAPLVLFFAIMLLPVIYLGGTLIEKFWTVLLIMFWVLLVVIDIKTNRMNQRRWMKDNLSLHLR